MVFHPDNTNKSNKNSTNKNSTTPSTTTAVPPKSPFFQPSTPQVLQPTPRGTRLRSVPKPVQESKSTIVGTMANLMNAIVGSGIVGIPFAMQQAGFVSGIGLIVLCAILTEKSLRLLIATAKHVQAATYETLAEAAFGTLGFRFIAINMFVMAYGAMLSYLMIVKDSWSVLLHMNHDVAQKRAILLVISLTIMVPLSSQRDVADLAKTSRVNAVLDSDQGPEEIKFCSSCRRGNQGISSG